MTIRQGWAGRRTSLTVRLREVRLVLTGPDCASARRLIVRGTAASGRRQPADMVNGCPGSSCTDRIIISVGSELRLHAYFEHSWSLAVEEQFYCYAAAVLVAAPSLVNSAVACALVLIAAIWARAKASTLFAGDAQRWAAAGHPARASRLGSGALLYKIPARAFGMALAWLERALIPVPVFRLDA